MNDRFSVNGKPNAPLNTTSAAFQARSHALRTKTDDRLDRLTALWREIEKKLIGLQPPRHVLHVYHKISRAGDAPDNDDCFCIGITKYAGKWRLCIGEYNEYESDHNEVPISWCPATNCSVEERVLAAAHVKKLEQKIVETGEQMLPRIDEAIRHLEDLLAT